MLGAFLCITAKGVCLSVFEKKFGSGIGVDITVLDEIAFGDHACGSYGGHGAWSTALLSRFDEVQGVVGQGLACFISVRIDFRLLGEDKIQELLTNPCRTLPLPHQ